MVVVSIIVRDRAIKILGFSMNNEFNALPWHDAELLSVTIDRSCAGNKDFVALTIIWPDGCKNEVVFKDCYSFSADMNFGVIAKESILDGMCISDSDKISQIKSKWLSLGVDLAGINCYSLITNSTNSKIDIYALSFALVRESTGSS